MKLFLLIVFLIAVVWLTGCGQDTPRFYRQDVVCEAQPACICTVNDSGQQQVRYCN